MLDLKHLYWNYLFMYILPSSCHLITLINKTFIKVAGHHVYLLFGLSMLVKRTKILT